MKYITSAPTREMTEPMNRYRVSFMAAYSRVLIQPQMAINKIHREDGDFVKEKQHEKIQRAQTRQTPRSPG